MMHARQSTSAFICACGSRQAQAYRPYWRRGRVAEGGGLLNRYRLVKAYRGFESLRLRHRSELGTNRPLSAWKALSTGAGGRRSRRAAQRPANGSDSKHVTSAQCLYGWTRIASWTLRSPMPRCATSADARIRWAGGDSASPSWCTPSRRISSLNLLDLARTPALVEERREGAVEPQDREPALFGIGLNPVAASDTHRLGGTEINRRDTVDCVLSRR